jgi:hypothetical protein
MLADALDAAEEKSSQLDASEKHRFEELQLIIEAGLPSFLEVGRALMEIKDQKLYREHWPTFELFVRERFGLSHHRANEIIRSTTTAECLLAGPARPNGDAPLPEGLSEHVMRPLSKIGSPELQASVWCLATRLTTKPTHTVVSKLVRIVTEAIQAGYGEPASKPKREEPANTVFLRVVYKVAAMEAVSPQLIVSSVSDADQARRCIAACREVGRRCHYIAEELAERFR